jgi:hypothetical protein
MALIECYECGKQISDAAQACPHCGAPVKKKEVGKDQQSPPPPPYAKTRNVGLGLGLGVLLFPYIFTWFVLREGYSSRAKALSIIWLAIVCYGFYISKNPENSVTTSNNQTSSNAAPTKTYPESNASYRELDSEVGCKSTYSDQKKEDIFNSKYRNHWMTWTGEIVLLESDNAALNMDGIGTQDLSIDFADKNAGYNLTKGERVTVRFLMDTEGGCFLPFSGDQATIVKRL